MSKNEFLSAQTLGHRELRVSTKRGITKKQVYQIIDRILELNGCTNCGLNGFDLSLLGHDRIFPFVADFDFVEKIDVRRILDPVQGIPEMAFDPRESLVATGTIG